MFRVVVFEGRKNKVVFNSKRLNKKGYIYIVKNYINENKGLEFGGIINKWC